MNVARASIRMLAVGALVLAWGFAQAQAQVQAASEDEGPPRTALKVCEDPNSLPFSNSKEEGFENRIASVFAKDLGLPVKYFYFPNRMNFIRNTLRFKLPTDDYPCDIVMGVPAEFDQVWATRPYYRSSYVLVYPKGKGLDAVHSSDDLLGLPQEQVRRLRIGLYDRSPASQWLAHHRMVDNGVPYQIMNANPDFYPGEDIEHDLVDGKIDAAIVWGPIGGYFAKHARSPLAVVPMRSEPGVPMEYSIAMGVRYGEPHWKAQVESMIVRHAPEIDSILREYGVPLLAIPPAKDKDDKK